MAMNLTAVLGKPRALLAHWWEETRETLVAIFAFKVDVVTLRGQMPISGETITMLYVGRRLNLSHFKKKFFNEVETLRSKKSNLFSFHKAIVAEEHDADVVFVDVGWPYNSRINKNDEYLELPDYICMTVSLKTTWDETKQNFRKTIRKNIGRLIRKNNYRSVPTNDPTIIKSFYETLYVTFIKSRHEDETHLTPRAIIEQRARDGTIVQVVDDDGVVAAGVYFPHGDTLRLLATGMPKAFLENPPVAAMQALYYFSLQYAFEHGYKFVNFLGTRAFPNDGLFQFKRKWGAAAEDTFSIDSILFKPNNTPAAVTFCEHFPMIARKDGALQLLLCTKSDVFETVEYEKLIADTWCDGIPDVKIVHMSDQPTVGSTTLPMSQADVRLRRCSIGSFAENYLHD